MSEANRRLLPPAPTPMEGVWGWGNVDVSPAGSKQKKSLIISDFLTCRPPLRDIELFEGSE